MTASNSTVEFLKNLSPDFQIVKGEFDENTSLPLSLVVTHGPLRIGFTNGYTIIPRGDPLSLLISARQMNVDVLIWGGSHKVETYTLEGKFFVNPGSATGAFSTDWPEIEEVGVDSKEPEEEEKAEKEGKKEKEEEEAKKDDNFQEKDTDKTHPLETHPAPKEDEHDTTVINEEELYDSVPSFTLLDIQGPVVTLYVYTYISGEVKVDKISYRKESLS